MCSARRSHSNILCRAGSAHLTPPLGSVACTSLTQAAPSPFSCDATRRSRHSHTGGRRFRNTVAHNSSNNVSGVKFTEAEIEERIKESRARRAALPSYFCPACDIMVGTPYKLGLHLAFCSPDLMQPAEAWQAALASAQTHPHSTPLERHPPAVAELLAGAKAKEAELRATVLHWAFRAGRPDESGVPLKLTAEVIATRMDLPPPRCLELLRRAKAGYPLVVDVDPDLQVIYEDDDIIAVNKPPGVTSTPVHRYQGGTMVNKLLGHLNKEPFPIHRLDMNTSGLMLFGKNSLAAAAMHQQFRDRSIKKLYLACGVGSPDKSTWTCSASIGAHPEMQVARKTVPDGLWASTSFTVIPSTSTPGSSGSSSSGSSSSGSSSSGSSSGERGESGCTQAAHTSISADGQSSGSRVHNGSQVSSSDWSSTNDSGGDVATDSHAKTSSGVSSSGSGDGSSSSSVPFDLRLVPGTRPGLLFHESAVHGNLPEHSSGTPSSDEGDGDLDPGFSDHDSTTGSDDSSALPHDPDTSSQERGQAVSVAGSGSGTWSGSSPSGQAQSDPWVSHTEDPRLTSACLVLCSPKTGRTHQIRLHLAHAGHPILGDEIYGVEVPWIKRQMLHAVALRLVHPVSGQALLLYAPPPADFIACVGALGMSMPDMTETLEQWSAAQPPVRDDPGHVIKRKQKKYWMQQDVSELQKAHRG
ncbi:MAG: hypothetical protein WDW36_009538 [Sanguina aurantia]